MNWLTKLSGKQKGWILSSLVLTLAVLFLGSQFQHQAPEIAPESLTVEMTIKEIAPVLEVSNKGFARELGLPLDCKKSVPLSSLGISTDQMKEAIEHTLSHSPGTIKYYLFGVLVMWGLVFLARLGRPDNSLIKEKKIWYPRWPYLLALLISVSICGFLLGKSPNPMEGVVKLVKSMVGLYPDPVNKVIAFFFFIVMAVVGNKLICGWACPFGALQELVYSIPWLSKHKSLKLPRWFTTIVRVGLFLIMEILIFGWVTDTEGFVLYHNINPFNLFDFNFDSSYMLVTVIASIVAGLIIYRPFCQLICPFGLVSWLAERISIFRVKIDHEKCISCNACAKACPTKAAEGILAKKRLPSDCFSCGRCLNTCPVDAIKYSCVLSRTKKKA